MSVSWGDGVTITVEAGFAGGSGFATWDGSLWDYGTWGPDITWTDISAYAMSFQTQRGFGRDVEGWNAGTASLRLLNTDGRFSPTNLSGPYTASGVSSVRPWRPIRISAAYGGTTYRIYRGYAISWTDSVDISGNLAIMDVRCVDEMGSLARYDGFAQSAAGAGDTFGARIHRILDDANHAGARTVGNGVVTMQATTLASNAVSELKLTADSEGGTVWIDDDGTFIGSDQNWLIRETRSITSQATFDDTTGLGYQQIAVSYDGDRTINYVSLARASGTERTVSDTDSRSLYGDKRFSRSDLIAQTDAQVLALANQILARHKDPELRVEQITIKPRGAPATLFPEVLGRKMLDRLTVGLTPPAGDAISRQVFVNGIAHTVTPDDWTTTYEFASASAYPTEFGVWDEGLWDTPAWSVT